MNSYSSIMSSVAVFAVVILAANIYVTDAAIMKCYQCSYNSKSTTDNPGCDQGAAFNPSNITVQTCDGKCMKLVGDFASYRTISRSCSTNCLNANGANQGSFCCSDKDFCNATWRMTATPLTLLLSAIAALFARSLRG